MESLNWLIKLHYMGVNGILADEMGLGKTIQTIALLAYVNLLKKSNHNSLVHIIIVPKVTIRNWLREMNKWLPELRVLYFYGNKFERKSLVDKDLPLKNYDVILTTFECAMKEKTALTKIHFDYLIIDEADRMVELGHYEDLDKIIDKISMPLNEYYDKEVDDLLKKKSQKFSFSNLN